MLATRKSDGKTLVIGHTVIQPFVGDIDDFKFFERAFLKVEDDKSLIVTDRWIQVFVPVHTLDPFTCQAKAKDSLPAHPASVHDAHLLFLQEEDFSFVGTL